MLRVADGALDTLALHNEWISTARSRNYGAFSVFVGIVREENHINALSFDIYLPILESWFDAWQKKAQGADSVIFMAHSRGDVNVGEVSFMCAIASRGRSAAFGLYEAFVEDFKANAPIWKYDIINGKRHYAKNRSKALKGARLC